MKKIVLSLFALACMGSLQAQQLEIPSHSPAASVKQTVGITEIAIDYSSPSVKGRVIWGSLVPYNELWRTGANAATKITFSKQVKIGETKVEAGTYSIFTIPGETEWTFILNKKLTSTNEYKKEDDVLRIMVKPAACDFRERLNFQITDFTESEGFIALEWEKVRIRVPFTTATDEMAMKSIENALNGSWRNYANAARYILEHNGDMNKALEYINQADQLKKDYWFILWIKAQIVHKQGNKTEALALAQRAYDLGMKEKEGNFFYKADVEKALKDWK